MYVTLSLRDIAVGLVLIALVILIIYIAIFFKNLIRTLKTSNEILKDVKTMTEIAEKRTAEIDGVVDGITESISKASKSNVGSGVLAQLSNIAAAINSIIKIIGRKKQP